MISRALKKLYYDVMWLPMWCSGTFYRTFRAPRKGTVRVHLGPGQERYIDGWINVDANLLGARPDVWADLRNALPFPDASVDVFYSHHVIEHLPEAALPFHFAQMHRCLKPGGTIRIAGPDADMAMRKYLENDHAWFGDWPVKRTSIGGRFANFVLCRGEHLAILTASFLEELMTDAGFVNVRARTPMSETGRPELIGSEVLDSETVEPREDAPFTIVVEAEKARVGALRPDAGLLPRAETAVEVVAGRESKVAESSRLPEPEVVGVPEGRDR